MLNETFSVIFKHRAQLQNKKEAFSNYERRINAFVSDRWVMMNPFTFACRSDVPKRLMNVKEFQDTQTYTISDHILW